MTPRILIVDHSEEVGAALTMYLRQETDWLVRTTDNGDQAWELIQQAHYDIVQTEGVLLGMHGLELCALIKRHHPAVKVLFASSWITADEAFAFGADEYINKPFQLVDYMAILEKLLGLHS